MTKRGAYAYARYDKEKKDLPILVMIGNGHTMYALKYFWYICVGARIV